ncbi:HPr family phosphocarrier protein [bacterium]|nr:HPr family phosphocarrier protein [bacterium]
MKEICLKIKNQAGIHARPSALLVNLAAKFDCEVVLSNGHFDVNGKSILGVISLAIPYRGLLYVKANGKDEEKAIESISKLVTVDNFFE